MFDDVKHEPEDMFEATDKVAPQVTPPTDQPVQAAPEPQSQIPPSSIAPTAPIDQPSGDARIAAGSKSFGGIPWKPIVLVLGIVVTVAAVFFLSMRILSSRTPITPTPPTSSTQEVEEVKEVQEVQEVDEVEEEPEKEPTTSKTDTDKDGLTDLEEEEYGTSPRAADTDSDGLFDLEEIRTWETDPLNPDTDGDGYLDGEEVSGGYNPNGEGELREIPTESG
jgi:hypothetical protein